MSRAKWLCALLVIASVVLASLHASAQPGATLVAIVTSEPTSSLTRRVRAELEKLGVDVIVLKPPAEDSTMRAPLEQIARSVGAAAAVRLVVSSRGKVEVWVADRVTGKTVVRELDATGAGASDASVAVGTVELLRASLMELHALEPPRGEVPATPKLEALALPTRSTTPTIPRLALAFGAGTELGLHGLGPSLDARLAVWARLVPRFGFSVFGETTLAPSHVATADGAVDVRSQWLGAALGYDFADATAEWVPRVSVGLAAAHVTTTGTALPPYVGASADGWFAAPLAGVGIGWAFARGLRLRADAAIAWALPAARVRTPTGDVGRWGAPALMLSLGIEMLWSR